MIEFAQEYFWLYCVGTAIGIGLTLLSVAGSIFLGLWIALARLSGKRPLRLFGSIYVALFRGVPPLVLLYIVYFGLPTLAQNADNAFLIALLAPLNNRLFAATIAFAINSAAYSAEIIRAAIISVPASQLEAARSFGMSHAQSMRRIVLPQALRVAFPPLGNEFITVLKGTSLASVIGVTELMRTAQMAAANTFQNLTAYSFAGVFYVVMVVLLQLGLSVLENRFTPKRPKITRVAAASSDPLEAPESDMRH
jgi:His/Glu/Gln/Arg/opine family amino acid ABC transporter permease subunit